MPIRHYWPIKDDDKCKSIKFAVDWGNNNEPKVRIYHVCLTFLLTNSFLEVLKWVVG